MKLTKTIKPILSSLLCLMLVAALSITMTACTNDTADSSSDTSSIEAPVTDTSSKESGPRKVGEGATEFAFTVTDKDGNVTEFTVCTDKTVVGDALQDTGLIEGEEGQYGLYVTKVNGIVADYNVDQTYWAFYIDGGYAATGVDQTNIETGKIYGFKVSK